MKINKITPQIAALYLGQKCDWAWVSGSTSGKGGVCTIDITRLGLLDTGAITHQISITPHLRRLESLTEDEERELYELEVGMRPGNDRNCVDWWSEFNPLDYKNSEIAIGSPAVWLKLLEWGFDLFGLIDSGLAKEVETTDENGLTASDYYHGITYPNG